MTDGLSAVQSRIAELQSLVGVGRPATGSASSAAFAQTLAAQQANGTSATPTTAGSTNLGRQAVDIAKKYLGIPYQWGGTDPKKGLDCSGLTQLVYKQVGVELPRTSKEQAKVGTEVGTIGQAKPGDLVFFGSPVHHVGIYVGDGKMLDAPRAGKDVQIRDVYETPSHIRRVLPQSTTSAAAVSTGGAGLNTPYADLFRTAGAKHGVDPSLLAAIAKNESSFNPKAVSHAGARGLMQLMPGTARELGVDPLNPAQAVDGAARLIGKHLKNYDGNVDLALAAYNAGPGNVRKYGGVPPFSETKTYIERVTKTWSQLR